MADSSTQPLQRVSPRGCRTATVAAVAAVALHLWGLYRNVGPPTPPWFPNADKVEHVAGFALPVVLILVAWWLRRRTVGADVSRRAVVVVAGVFAAHAVVSELIQHFFYRTRTGDPRDALADAGGVALGLVVFALLRRRHGRATR